MNTYVTGPALREFREYVEQANEQALLDMLKR